MLVAGQYADKAVNMGFDAISLDKTETDIVAEIDFGIKRLGYEMSFETMVLTGNNAANPHGIPGSNKVENDALLLFDLGCMVNGYASDMTRTVAVGKPDDFKKEIYHLTLEAQQAAIDMIKPGVTAHDVDRAARSVIEKAGYGEYFNHRLGHGSEWTCMNFLLLWKEMTWCLKKACASQSNQESIFQVKSVSVSKIVVMSQKDGFGLFTETSKDLLYFD